ncbi:MAG: CoA transferase [Steroidobacteraceae bacterium]
MSIASLLVVDLSVGLASATMVKMLTDSGARVIRIPPTDGDPFAAVYPAYESLKADTQQAVLAERDTHLAATDVCLIGGEDYPGLQWQFDAKALSEKYPRLVVVELGAYAPGARTGPAVDLLVQARTGVVNEQLTGQPVQLAVAMPSYGAALTGLIGLWAAAIERERSGKGQIVFASLQQGLSLFWSQVWMEAQRADALFDKLPPKDVQHLIFECADGDYLHFVLGVPNALAKLYAVLGIQIAVDPNERGIPTLARGPKSYFGDRDIIEPAIRGRKRDELVAALNAAGLAAEPVLLPGEAWSEAHILAGGFLSESKDGATTVNTPLRFVMGDAATGKRTTGIVPVETNGTLSGIRVIDFGNFIAGPYASKLLSDLGADVIRVEPPNSLAALTGMRNTYVSNRGKRSIIIDMKAPEGLELVRKLCASADVATHNFRMGVDGRLGIDPQSLRRVRPDIVTLATSGYGSVGPKANDAGWDMVMQALCGHEARAGGRGNPPLWYRTAFVDFATGAFGAIAVLMSLHARLRTGAPVAAENSLLGSALFLMAELVRLPDGKLTGAPLLNSRRTGFHPAEQLYRTSDGWIAIAARSDDMASNLATALKIVEAPTARAQWTDEIAEKIAAALIALTNDEAVRLLESAGVWVERCNEGAWPSLRDNADARRSGLVVAVEDAKYGEILSTFGAPVQFSRSNVRGALRSTPQPGEHTREILGELGMGGEAIAAMFDSGAVR